MMMHNSPQFIMTWLAILKMAAVPAFINNQIAGPVLVHSLKVADAKMLVFDYEVESSVQGCLKEIQDLGYRLFTTTPKEHILGQVYSHLSEDVRQSIQLPTYFGYMDWQHCSIEGFPRKVREHVTMKDPSALIYTSGTTGFPKAAIMDHGRCNCRFSQHRCPPFSNITLTSRIICSGNSLLGTDVRYQA